MCGLGGVHVAKDLYACSVWSKELPMPVLTQGKKNTSETKISCFSSKKFILQYCLPQELYQVPFFLLL
jgi:hypothetical protein